MLFRSSSSSWEQIKAKGVLVVGTSADYPPFSYYNQQSQIDGFDPALIRKMGERLGVKVEVKDFAFEGLDEALMLGQIDVAIAAISVTPERQAWVDFSTVYYASTEGILTSVNSQVPSITSVDQMAAYRVAVHKSTVYETWLRTSLVDTGKMPSANLFIYTDTRLAIQDLSANRIDLAVADLQPALAAVTTGGLKLVGQGLSPQQYAIATNKGNQELVGELNRVLTDLFVDGTVATLTTQYLGLTPDQVQPTPTPAPPQPTATPLPTPQCIDGMGFIYDLNLDDDNMTNPPVMDLGEAFTKGWRVQNTGTCPWTPEYTLVYVHGNQTGASMGGQPTSIIGTVPAGSMVDLYVDLIAPMEPGTYQGFWQLTNASGIAFGERIWVGITVASPATATPKPTKTPVPGITFYSDRNSITAGEAVVFTWDVTGSQEVYFYRQ